MTFYNVQPVVMDLSLLKAFLTTPTHFKRLSEHFSDRIPSWLEDFQVTGNAYKALKTISLDSTPTTLLESDLGETRFHVNGKHPLSDHIDYEGVEHALIYDVNTMYFILVFKIPVRISDNMNALLETGTSSNEGKDLYNTIRNLMVKEHDGMTLGKWGETIRTHALDKIRLMMRNLFSLKFDDDKVRFKNNTGNITNIVHPGADKTGMDKLKAALFSLNQHAERRDYADNALTLSDGTYYDFNGRFHTIVMTRPSDDKRFMPIQFHMQYMWIYLMELYDLMDALNQEIMANCRIRTLNTQNSLIDSIIQKAQYLHIFHENFKRAIEADNKNIYNIINPYWNIDSFLSGMGDYVDNFKDYLSRKHTKLTTRNNNKQRNILFFISMVQLVSLLGVWSAYVSLLDEAAFESSTILLEIFGTKDALMTFNLFLPFMILTVVAVLSTYGFLSRKE